MAKTETRGRAKKVEFGSDVIVDMMRAFGIQYAALNPGASYRGLHDSLVNYGGNEKPEIILCCHEEIAVSMALSARGLLNSSKQRPKRNGMKSRSLPSGSRRN